MRTEPLPEQDMDPDALVALLDALCAEGSQHIDLRVGEETKVQTVNSTALCQNGPCAVPTLGGDPDEEPKGGI